MTYAEKIEWLEKVNDKELLEQYTTVQRNAAEPFKYMKILGISYEEIMENVNLVRAEILRRMAEGRESGTETT